MVIWQYIAIKFVNSQPNHWSICEPILYLITYLDRYWKYLSEYVNNIELYLIVYGFKIQRCIFDILRNGQNWYPWLGFEP